MAHATNQSHLRTFHMLVHLWCFKLPFQQLAANLCTPYLGWGLEGDRQQAVELLRGDQPRSGTAFLTEVRVYLYCYVLGEVDVDRCQRVADVVVGSRVGRVLRLLCAAVDRVGRALVRVGRRRGAVGVRVGLA